MSETKLSACKYCGQTAMVDAETEAEALHLATMECDCEEAIAYQQIHMKMEEAITEMREMFQAERIQEHLINMMENNIRTMAAGLMSKAQYDLPNGKKLKVTKRDRGFSVECSSANKKKVEV